jgi:hypothetical protein
MDLTTIFEGGLDMLEQRAYGEQRTILSLVMLQVLCRQIR